MGLDLAVDPLMHCGIAAGSILFWCPLTCSFFLEVFKTQKFTSGIWFFKVEVCQLGVHNGVVTSTSYHFFIMWA